MQRRSGCRVAVLALLAMLAGCRASWDDEPKLVAVLVAKTDIPAFEAIKEPEKLFKVDYYKKGEEPRDAVTDFDQMKGQYLLNGLAEDQPVKKADLLPEGTRAIAVSIPKDGLGNAIPGSRVDVYATIRKDGKEPITELVLKDLLVLAVDVPKDGGEGTVTFAVALEAAARLVLAGKAAEIHLKLSAPELPKGTRAMAVKIEPAIAGFLRPGNRVDVLVVSAKAEKEPACKIVLEDLLLLAGDEAKKDIPASATLAVTVEQAEKLADGVKAGKIHLAVRPPDKEKAAGKPAGLAEVPKGMRAVGIQVNPVSLAGGFILPFCYVVIIGITEKPNKDVEAETVFENLLVLAVGQSLEREGMLGGVVVLAVPKEHVEKLLAFTAATSADNIRLVLRAPRDNQTLPRSKFSDWTKPLKQEPPPR
jgi:Flp pilus assembly protein CpaB